MKKNILLTSLLFGTLFLSINSAQAAPPPPHGGPGGPGGGHHRGPSMHRPPSHGHIHHPPRMHSRHHVRHYGGYYGPCYCRYCCPIGLLPQPPRIYYPMHHGHLGASFHISI